MKFFIAKNSFFILIHLPKPRWMYALLFSLFPILSYAKKNEIIENCNKGILDTIVVHKSKTITSQITQANTVYIIRDELNLCLFNNNKTLQIPPNSVLLFEGGCLNNGRIIFNNTLLQGAYKFDESVYLDGTILNHYLTSSIVGCKGDGKHDDAPNLRNAIRLLKNRRGGELHLDEGNFLLNSGDDNSLSWMFRGFSVFEVPDNFTLTGEGNRSKLLYNPNRLPIHSSGNIYCGCVFSNERGGNYYKVHGNITMRNFTIEYMPPILNPSMGGDYGDGQFLSIYRPLYQFEENYDDYNVLIDKVNFYNIVGHQGILCNGADTVLVTECKHIKAGLDTDSNNKDYSFFYINSKVFIASGNTIDVNGTIYETHCEYVDIHNNIFLNSGVCCLPVGGMNDIMGNLRPATVVFHDNIVSTCYVISPFYYRNTAIKLIECYNNTISLSSGRFQTRYLFPSTDNADIHLDGLHVPIEKVHIHNEVIIQSDKTEVNNWNRIFRTTGITELIIDHCLMKNLSNMPVLAGNNNGEVTLRKLVFSDNVLEYCGKEVAYVYPDKRDAKQNQSVVNIMMWGADNFDGSKFSVFIERNRFVGANPYTILLSEDITNYDGDINLDVFIKDNDIKSILPISTNMVNSNATFLGKVILK